MPARFPIDEPTTDCGPTLAAVQAVLDGDRPTSDLDADPHPAGCGACRGRVAEARVLLAVLATPPQAVPVPARFATGVLSAVRADRRVRNRRRALVSVGGGLAVAAAVLIAAWVVNAKPAPQLVVERTHFTPEPRPVRVSAELARAGDALRESSRPLAEPAAAAPKVFASLAGAMIPPMPAPMGDDVAPVGASLAELPSAALTGLEPVTGTTQKAFNRLLRDVGMLASARPKS